MREEFLDTIALLTNEQLYQLVSAFQSPEDARQLLRTRSAFLKRLEELFDKRQLSRNVKL
jgi:hypothetical protein